MTNLVAGQWNDPTGYVIGTWHEQTSGNVVAPPYSALAWLDKDRNIVASALFNNYNKFNVEVHLCMPRKFNIGKARTIFRYVFQALKCTRLSAKIKRKNEVMINITKALDFENEAVLKEYWGIGPENDAVCMVMTSNSVKKWIK